MDITRWPNPHVAFGAGVHHCLGATIARVEGQEVFRALADRYPDMEVKPHEFEYQPTMALRWQIGIRTWRLSRTNPSTSPPWPCGQ